MLKTTAIGLVCVLLTGCGTVHYQVQSDKPVLLGAPPSENYRVVRHATDHGKKLWLFWWLAPTGESRDHVLSKLVNSGDGAANVSIHESYDFLDFVVQNWSVLLCGIPGFTNTFNEDFEADVLNREERR